MLEPGQPKFKIGDEVRLKSRPDRAGQISPPDPALISEEYWYTVYFGPGKKGRHPEYDLELYSQLSGEVAEILKGGRFAGREAFTKLLCHLRLSTSLRSQIYALAASRTTFYAYQFKPILKFLESRNHRLLVADEVGLGKTIEAGLILTELRQRRPVKRALIVSPSHLLTKWRDEMRNRFDLEFAILDKWGALEFLRRFEEEKDEAQLRGIVSLQTLRGRALMERWEEVDPALDFVVFDEAGRLRNKDTRSHAAAAMLAENADALLLLTATPVQTGNENLFHLLQLVDPDDFANFDVFKEQLNVNRHVLGALRCVGGSVNDLNACARELRQVEETSLVSRFIENPLYKDVLRRLEETANPTRRDRIELQRDLSGLNILGHVLSRTRKREVHERQPVRKSRVVRADPTPAEQEFYDLVTRLCQAAYKKAKDYTLATFAVMMPQRQAASCMVAMIDNLAERFKREDYFEDTQEACDLTPEDYDFDQDKPPPSLVDWAPLGDLDNWRRRLAAQDSKWETLKSVLEELREREPREKIIVYSFFKKTLAYLEGRLTAEGIKTVLISGDVPSVPDDPELDERGNRIERFRDDPQVQVLLSTEVGDEGLDLQFAHNLVNYDLPWNPMRVEQRIGRLDRIGQESDYITIVSLSMPGTIEDRILEKLYKRIRVFEESVGDLEAILGEEIKRLEIDLFQGLTPEEQEERIERAAEVIEKQKLDNELFEKQATALIGHDEFFFEEIERARERRRYLSGEELLLYLRDFLIAHHPACVIKETDVQGLYVLRLDEGLRAFVREAIAPGDLGLRLFLQRSNRGEVQITTDPEQAQRNRRLEFLTFYHPLVRAVNQYYDSHSDELHPVSHVRLASSNIPRGKYVWFLYLVEITGARPLKDLEFVALNMDSKVPLEIDDTDILLSEMLSLAEPVPAAGRGPAASVDLIQRADEVLSVRLDDRFKERQRYNEALVANQLASIEETFKRNVRIREERIETAKTRGRRESYIRGLETGLRNLEEAHQTKIREIESGRSLGKSFFLRGAGLVEVISNE